MGNARWTGIPLRTVLEKTGISSKAMYVTFDGLDKPVLPNTPDFKKALGNKIYLISQYPFHCL